MKCFQNAYILKMEGQFNVHLNMARWFYALKAFEPAATLLKSLLPTYDVRVLYLLGVGPVEMCGHHIQYFVF